MPVQTLCLDGEWKLIDADHGAGETAKLFSPKVNPSSWLDVEVPGDIHPALQNAGRIPDPFWAINTEECTWTGRREWWHRRDFAVPADFTGDRIELVLDGVDTYATVYVNGQKVGETSNMFRQYRFDVTPHIRPGAKNTVAICVGPTLTIIEARDTQKYLACFYTPRVLARKAQCQFSWDWAPHLPALGIWQSVRLEAVSEGVIQDVHVRTRINGELFIAIETDGYGKEATPETAKDELVVRITDGAKTIVKRIPRRGSRSFAQMRVPNPKLWWPNGYGDPHLYRYSVSLVRGRKTLHTLTGRFGIREVKLIEEPNADGTHGFKFRVNGVDVFCLGANWVPSDCFPGTVRKERYANLIRLSREANFNMLRIWGGGIYEKDAFYDLCDENGIMIWQDLMFACADIPDDDYDFAMSVIPEFEYQAKRLRNHPCIVHWCGGNEKTGTFGAMMSYGDNIARYIARGVINDHVPDLAYTPQSPYSHTDVGNDTTSGDTHGGCWEDAFRDDIRKFRDHIERINTVFNSEFGLHGPCQMRSVRKFMPEDKLWPLNEVWEHHIQDNPYNSLSETFVQVQEKCGTILFHKPDSAAEFVKVGGTFHAELLREELEHHRRRMFTNAGAMVWMLNDCWPCASWSLIDYYGLPKQVYYALKRACAPVILSIRKVKNGYDLYVVNGNREKLSGNLRLELKTVTGENKMLARRKVNVPAQTSQVVVHLGTKELPKLANSYLYAKLLHGPQDAVAETTWFPDLWKRIAWPEPRIEMFPSRRTHRDGEFRCLVTLTTQNYARCVNLATEEDIYAYFSDNFFDMIPGESKCIEIRSPQPFDPARLRLNHWLTIWDDRDNTDMPPARPKRTLVTA